MTGELLAYLGGWWTRWSHRASPVVPRRTIAFVPEPESPGLVEGVKERAPERPAAARRTATPGAAQPVRHWLPADPEVRAATLASLEGLRQIPALQSLVQGVNRTMCREGVSVDEIVASIQKDSALCVRLLTMANSVAVASVEKVVDLQTAIQLLGVSRVRRSSQAAFTLRDEQRMADGVDWRHLWIHALATASIAEELERRIRPSGSSQVYMAALLHDVGKIVLSTVDPDAYRSVMASAWNGEGRLEALELSRLGVHHREAGAIFAGHCGLSKVVREAVAHHNDPGQAAEGSVEVALVSIANYISKERGLGFSGSRLDEGDGDLENLPAWRVIERECGGHTDIETLLRGMGEFFSDLRDDVRAMHDLSA